MKTILTAITISFILFSFFLASCSLQGVRASSIDQTLTDKDECEQIDTMYKMWGGLAAGFGVLSGAGGVSTIAVDSKNGQLGIGITSLVCGAGSAVCVWLQSSYAEDYLKDCVE